MVGVANDARRAVTTNRATNTALSNGSGDGDKSGDEALQYLTGGRGVGEVGPDADGSEQLYSTAPFHRGHPRRQTHGVGISEGVAHQCRAHSLLCKHAYIRRSRLGDIAIEATRT